MSTATPPPPSPTLLTASEFARRYGGRYVELVDGVVKELPVPFQEHGVVCSKAAYTIGTHVIPNDLGHLTTNDSFVKTMADPDRVRGADVCFFSYERLPKGPMPSGLLEVAPHLRVA